MREFSNQFEMPDKMADWFLSWLCLMKYFLARGGVNSESIDNFERPLALTNLVSLLSRFGFNRFLKACVRFLSMNYNAHSNIYKWFINIMLIEPGTHKVSNYVYVLRLQIIHKIMKYYIVQLKCTLFI